MNKTINKIVTLTLGVIVTGICYFLELVVAIGVGSFLNGSMLQGNQRILIAVIVAVVDVLVLFISKEDKGEKK